MSQTVQGVASHEIEKQANIKRLGKLGGQQGTPEVKSNPFGFTIFCKSKDTIHPDQIVKALTRNPESPNKPNLELPLL